LATTEGKNQGFVIFVAKNLGVLYHDGHESKIWELDTYAGLPIVYIWGIAKSGLGT
jgi:hypothetical protein